MAKKEGHVTKDAVQAVNYSSKHLKARKRK